MATEFAGDIPKRENRHHAGVTRGAPRSFAVQLLGPLTMLAGVVWAIAQPYRIAFLHPDGKGMYDYFFQPPLLVVVVGLVFAVLIAPGLVDDLEKEGDGPPA